MKRLSLLGIFAALAVVLGGTASVGRAAVSPAPAHKSAGVLLYVFGSFGDLGFLDSARAGVQRAQSKLGVSAKIIAQPDSSQVQSQLLSLAATHRYDLIIVTTDDAGMSTAVKALVKRYPKQRVIDFDDNTYASQSSVSTILYRQNEGSFLAGALATMVAEGHLKYANGKRVVGMVGGAKIQVIDDFKDGYVQGAKTVDPRMQVRVTYIGGSGGNDTWENKPAGARLARSLYDQGASVVYQVAGGSGLGVLQQAKAMGRYAIGVDSNQDGVAPGHVIGSVTKRVDNSLYDLIGLFLKGKLKGAHTYSYGLQNNGVTLTRDAYTRAIVTASMYHRLDALAARVASGKIHVKSEFK